MFNYVLFTVLALSLFSCYKPNSLAYNALYSHLENLPEASQTEYNSNYFLLIYVNARHLDYTDNYSFLNTVAKHPSDGNKNRDVGHAWIYLQGMIDGEIVYLYGGHSGETGLYQARYFDGIMNYIDFGYANPTRRQLNTIRYEANPVKYLWEIQKDGFFEWGAGIHRPTYGGKVDLTEEQFKNILGFAQQYDYAYYSLIGNQCSSFVAQVASLAGLDLECEITIAINKELYLKGEHIRFWKDPCYSQLTISSPDIIERSLIQAVREGKAQYVDCK